MARRKAPMRGTPGARAPLVVMASIILRETTCRMHAHAAATLCLAMALALGFPGPVRADDPPLMPQTKIRLSVVQWMPIKGAYEQWPALGGEFVVSRAGTLTLPVIGTIAVGRLDSAALASDVAQRLQEKIGLVYKPDTTIEIVEYPPIYVVGDVATPGEYKFRSGLTVLQALALGGGQKQASAATSDQQVRLVGELKGLDNEILRSLARVARFEAEMSGAKEIKFPQTSLVNSDAQAAEDIFARERIIFSARANELYRQTRSLGELRDLLNAEIGVLEEKIKAADFSIDATQKELTGVTQLVEKGIAVTSRKSDLERALAGFRTERLDQVTAVMRARQGITEATRSIDGLRDKHETEVAAELQDEQARLEQLRTKREVAQRLLLDALADPASGKPGEKGTLNYSVTRASEGGTREFAAEETTLLQPGDVVKATYIAPRAKQIATAGEQVSTAAGDVSE